MADTRARVGVLSFHSSKESKAILNAVEALGHDPVWIRETDGLLRFRDGEFELEPDVDVLINRLLLSTATQPVEAVGIANAIARFRPIINDPDAAALASHKIASAAALVEAGVPVPDTALALGQRVVRRVRPDYGDAFVYKTIVGTHGGGAWKVSQDDHLTGTVGTRRAFLQALVETPEDRPRDLRVYVVGGRVVGAMFRYATSEDWRTNVARGGTVEDATDELPADVEGIAIAATAAVGLDCAGVDLIEGDDGWVVLEVNPTAGFKGLFRATGRSPAPAIAGLAVERAGGSVDDARGRSLMDTFDDSRPSCVPHPETVDTDAPVVGLTERVVVSGTTDTRTVVGRSNPTSARTRIDLQLAARIGAGPIQVGHPARDAVGRRRRLPVVDVVVGIGGTERTVEAFVEDLEDEDHPLLLGRDVLGDFQIDVGMRSDGGDRTPLEE